MKAKSLITDKELNRLYNEFAKSIGVNVDELIKHDAIVFFKGRDFGYEQGKKDQAKIDKHELNQYRRILTICYEDD